MPPTAFATPKTQGQATAETFFNRMQRADRLGLPVGAQRELHERWAATTTVREKLGLCEALFLTLLELEGR